MGTNCGIQGGGGYLVELLDEGDGVGVAMVDPRPRILPGLNMVRAGLRTTAAVQRASECIQSGA